MKIRSFIFAGVAFLFSIAPALAGNTNSASSSSQDLLKDLAEFGKTIKSMCNTFEEWREDGSLDYFASFFISADRDKPVLLVCNCNGELNEPVWKKKKVKKLLEQYEILHTNYDEGEKFLIVPVKIKPEDAYYRSDLNAKTLIKYLEDGLVEYSKFNETLSQDKE
jgi:hypothetical protein